MSGLVGRRVAGASFEQLGAWPAEADLGVYVVDENGRIVGTHARTLELLRWTQEELLGRDGHEMLHRKADGGTLPAPSAR
ncbi:PAS domain-containing protein [Streptacidiphilus monticola]